MNKFCLFLFLLLSINTFCQKKDKEDSSSVIITEFATKMLHKDSVWNIQNSIKLPTQPEFLALSVNDKSDTKPNFICIIIESIMMIDTFKIGENKTINFTNLTGGDYQITFINLNNNQNTKIDFTIEFAFWQKWWFSPFVFSVLFVVLSIIFYFFYLIRLRQQARTQLIRDNIARDLHDDMGSYLSSISILSQNVEKLSLNDPAKARIYLQKIGEIARQVMDTMGDIVWSINPAQDSMEQIIERMKDLGNEIFLNQAVGMEFSVSNSVTKTNLSLENRRDFFLIYKEALTNIQKYANASKVLVELLIEGNTITMNIKDNGKGFHIEHLNPHRTFGGNGLKNMKVRAEKLGGKLMIESKIEEGTTVKLVFEL
jgi:hypothetical protein